MNYEIVRLKDKPEIKERAAQWFHEKWGIPLEAYIESMNDCLTKRSPVPQWLENRSEYGWECQAMGADKWKGNGSG